MAGSSSPRSERTPVPSRSDFSFAFQDQRFCDCMLRIHVSDDARVPTGSAGSEKVSRIREVAVSTLVLAVNSVYFKTMFTGSFLEGTDRTKVDILMEPEYEPHMDELLHFMYFGVLPPHTRKSSASILKLLVLADRFDAEDCFDACCDALCAFLPDLKAADALHIVALLNPVQQDPRLERAAARARDCIVRTYSPMLANPSKYSFPSLPKVGLLTLLDAEDLETESEDDVVRAAWAWVKGNHASPDEWNEALCRLVLPRVRVQALSPRMVHWVCARVAEQIKAAWLKARPAPSPLPAHHPESSPTPGPAPSLLGPGSQGQSDADTKTSCQGPVVASAALEGPSSQAAGAAQEPLPVAAEAQASPGAHAVPAHGSLLAHSPEGVDVSAVFPGPGTLQGLQGLQGSPLLPLLAQSSGATAGAAGAMSVGRSPAVLASLASPGRPASAGASSGSSLASLAVPASVALARGGSGSPLERRRRSRRGSLPDEDGSGSVAPSSAPPAPSWEGAEVPASNDTSDGDPEEDAIPSFGAVARERGRDRDRDGGQGGQGDRRQVGRSTTIVPARTRGGGGAIVAGGRGQGRGPGNSSARDDPTSEANSGRAHTQERVSREEEEANRALQEELGEVELEEAEGEPLGPRDANPPPPVLGQGTRPESEGAVGSASHLEESTSGKSEMSTGPSSEQATGHSTGVPASYEDTLPPATLEAMASLTAALVAMSEMLLVQSRMVPRGMSLASCLTGLPLDKPRAGRLTPEARLTLEVPLRRCREWQPSSASLAESSPTLFHGRWLTLNAVVDERDTLGLYIQYDKGLNALDGIKEEFKLHFDIGLQTAKTRPAYQSIQRKKPTMTFTRREIEAGTGWGNAVSIPWSKMLQEHRDYFPEGSLRLRADLWPVAV